MPDDIIKVIEGPNAQVQIVRRGDGAFTYRTSARVSDGWSASGPDLGIYDSADTAEAVSGGSPQ